MSGDLITISRSSLQNIINELDGLRKVVFSEEDIENKDIFLQEGIEEITYNIAMLIEGVEYYSDEYAYLSKNLKECE